MLAASEKPAIVSEQFTVRGDIDSEGTLHVEGSVIGTVKAQTIHISATGRIEGDVACEVLSVKGSIQGSIVCQELLLSSSARVAGEVAYRLLSVAKGARLKGEVRKTAPGDSS